jgi:hypothetical protein
MVESTGGTALGEDGDASERPEPPTTLIAAPGGPPAEPPTRAIAIEKATIEAASPSLDGQPPEKPADEPTKVERAEPVWPGLTAAGLPSRVPRQGDEETMKEAFADSWEAVPTSPTPLTRKPFTPTYLSEPPRQRTWRDDLDPTGLISRPDGSTPSGSTPDPQEPPSPKEPPEPVEPPEPRQPPEPKEPPRPPAPPSPSPFPSPSPVPTPPEPVHPSPMPSPVPPGPPAPPVPAPPPPFPPPPGPVPPPPTIVAGTSPAGQEVTVRITQEAPSRPAPPRPAIGTSTYQGGNYTELVTEPITGVVATTDARAAATDPMEMSGSLTGHLLSRNQEMYRRRERRRRLRTFLWVSFGLLFFAIGIAVVVDMLAGDFIRSIFDTFSDWAG